MWHQEGWFKLTFWLKMTKLRVACFRVLAVQLCAITGGDLCRGTTAQTSPTWNMLSSPFPLPLEEPPGLELSPLFGFLDGFSDWLVFFRLAFKQANDNNNLQAPTRIHGEEKWREYMHARQPSRELQGNHTSRESTCALKLEWQVHLLAWQRNRQQGAISKAAPLEAVGLAWCPFHTQTCGNL